MLVLGRLVGERITIGQPGDVLTEPIVITLVRHGGWDGVEVKATRLGIEAPRDIRIMRDDAKEVRE